MRFMRCGFLSERIEIRVNRYVGKCHRLRHTHSRSKVVVQFSRLLKVNHWRKIVLTDSFAHRRMQDGIHQLDIQEVDLRLSRMDIDVDIGWINLNIKEIARKTIFGNHLHVGVLDGMMQIGMLDKALVHKEILLATGLFGILCLDDITIDTHTFSLLTHR